MGGEVEPITSIWQGPRENTNNNGRGNSGTRISRRRIVSLLSTSQGCSATTSTRRLSDIRKLLYDNEMVRQSFFSRTLHRITLAHQFTTISHFQAALRSLLQDNPFRLQLVQIPVITPGHLQAST
jgi:hypothetical protein